MPAQPDSRVATRRRDQQTRQIGGLIVRGALKRLVVIGAASLMVVGLVRTSAAQGDASKAEISGGWQYSGLRSNDEDTWEHFEKGWYGDVAFRVRGMWSAVAQVSGAYETRVDQAGDIKFKLHPYLFGIRATSRVRPKTDAFAQFLVGGTNLNLRQEGNFDESTTAFTFQTGGGAKIHLSDRVGVRVVGEYIRIMPNDDNRVAQEAIHGPRLSVGVAFGFGR